MTCPRRLRPLLLPLLCALLPILAGCESVHYYGQAVAGHLSLLSRRVPVERGINDPDTDPRLRDSLQMAQEARRFATEVLLLPENASYTAYAPLERDAVTYNVVATPEFSLRPRQWCFLVVGCVNYRGYFSLQDAQDKARALQEAGDDVVITRAAAYSTLGWFNDPIPGPVLRWEPDRMVGLIFHELAHQKLYVADDNFKVDPRIINTSPRIGVDYAGKDAELPWRYTLSR